MLVLSRKPGEAIRIGTELEVKVISIRSNRVRLAFEGPRHIRIMRSELNHPGVGPKEMSPRHHSDVATTEAH